jgi:hypothetical protein
MRSCEPLPIAVPVDKTEENLGLGSDTLNQCRYILEKFEPNEINEILEGRDTISRAYKRSVKDKEERRRKKDIEREERIKTLRESKASSIPFVTGGRRKSREKVNFRRVKTLDKEAVGYENCKDFVFPEFSIDISIS